MRAHLAMRIGADSFKVSFLSLPQILHGQLEHNKTLLSRFFVAHDDCCGYFMIELPPFHFCNTPEWFHNVELVFPQREEKNERCRCDFTVYHPPIRNGIHQKWIPENFPYSIIKNVVLFKYAKASRTFFSTVNFTSIDEILTSVLTFPLERVANVCVNETATQEIASRLRRKNWAVNKLFMGIFEWTVSFGIKLTPWVQADWGSKTRTQGEESMYN